MSVLHWLYSVGTPWKRSAKPPNKPSDANSEAASIGRKLARSISVGQFLVRRIGRATALIFAREGANVVCADINEKRAGETAAEVNRKGSKALAIKVDVTKRIEVDEMAERAIAAFGQVQFLFNSAGAAIRRAKFLKIDDSLMEKTFALNVNGTLYGMQALLPHMLANRHGVIVNMASMAHRRGGPGSSIHYAVAKGAVVSMTLGVAREFATQGIRALSISPGPIKTPFQSAAQSSPEYSD